MNHRALFAAWGLASYSAIGLGMFAGFLVAIAQTSVSFSELSFARWLIDRTLVLVMVSMGLGFAAGWVALYFGRRLTCSNCNRDLLPSDGFGFQGLHLGPVVRAARGELVCPLCARPNRSGSL